jgi:hypothetical protein
MGKSLNLDMLRCFIDCKQDVVAEGLFKGFYIESQPCFDQANSAPVIYLSFRDSRGSGYQEKYRQNIEQCAQYYLSEDQYSRPLALSLKEEGPVLLTDALRNLTESLYQAYNTEPYVLIDEYDYLIMGSVNKPHFDEVREFTKSVLSSALKDNPSLGKAVLTGVNRIAQESMFSDLNNLDVFDVFTSSSFDEDFGFTEDEVRELCTPEELADVREWYNGERIGEATVYFTYSVMSYLSKGVLNNYWGQSGTTDTIRAHLTTERVETITELINNFGSLVVTKTVKQRLTTQDIKGYSADAAFYSLLIQTGYLTFERSEKTNVYLLALANRELVDVWREFVLTDLFELDQPSIEAALAAITKPERFSEVFTGLISNKLSYFDFDEIVPEKTYHSYIAGLLAGIGIPFVSNRESGYGRYDVMALFADKTIIFEFKVAKSLKGMPRASHVALNQIIKRNYAADAPADKPVYMVGIGFFGKMARVVAQALQTTA